MPATPVLIEHFVTLRGRTIRYLAGGEGKPLVLCHGFLSSGEEFGGRFAALATSRSIIAPDLPGNGQSAPLKGAHTSAALGTSVLELLDHLGVTTFDLGGLCLGASVATAIAKSRPTAVNNLILHTPLLAPRLVRLPFRVQVKVLSNRPLWTIVAWLSRRRLVSNLYKRTLVEGPEVDIETSDINFANQLRASPRAAREWLKDSLSRNDLHFIKTRGEPTLIIVPRQDRLVDVGRLQNLLHHDSKARLFIDEEGGHGWSPEAVKRHLLVMQNLLSTNKAP